MINNIHTGLKKKFENDNVKWFKSHWIDYKDPKACSNIWTMEYAPEYLDAINTKGDKSDISRRRHLTGLYNKDNLLRDINKICLSLNSDEYDRYKKYFSYLNYEVNCNSTTAVIKGPEITFEIEKK